MVSCHLVTPSSINDVFVRNGRVVCYWIVVQRPGGGHVTVARAAFVCVGGVPFIRCHRSATPRGPRGGCHGNALRRGCVSSAAGPVTLSVHSWNHSPVKGSRI